MQTQIKINVNKEVTIDLPYPISDEAAKKIKRILEEEQKPSDDVLDRWLDFMKNNFYKEYFPVCESSKKYYGSEEYHKEKAYYTCACGHVDTRYTVLRWCKYCGTYAKYR